VYELRYVTSFDFNVTYCPKLELLITYRLDYLVNLRALVYLALASTERHRLMYLVCSFKCVYIFFFFFPF